MNKIILDEAEIKRAIKEYLSETYNIWDSSMIKSIYGILGDIEIELDKPEKDLKGAKQ